MGILWQEIKEIDTSKKALRSVGWLCGWVLLSLAALVWWGNDCAVTTAAYVLGGIGGTLVGLGLAVPVVLKPVYRVWMALAVVLGFIMTRVILSVVYYLVMTPIGLAMRLFGKDPMHRRIDPDAASYWIEKSYDDESPERLEKYY